MSDQTIENSGTLTANAFTRTGYTFAGWNTKADGTGTDYSNGAAITATESSKGPVTLYAKWTPVNYTISYDLDGGSVASANPTNYTIESDAITLNNPTKDGYTFAGWTGTGLGSATTSVTIASGSTGNRSYTATYNAIPTYSATWDATDAEKDKWAISPATPAEGDKVTATYSGSRHVKSVKYVKTEIAGEYFTVNGGGTKVVFSQGNLQATYNGSSWTWAFADHQYDYIGNAEGNTKVTDATPFVSGYSGTSTTVDLFGWVGASSNWTDVNMYGITSSTATNNTNGYGNVATESLKAEWNSTNLTITNAGGYTWRTLTGGSGGEWEYIFSTRASGATVNGTADARYTHATINTDGTAVNGMILFLDGCTINAGSATTWGAINKNSKWGTKCTTAQWTHLEELGCVFLPVAGYRNGSTVYYADSYGLYWSSSPDASNVNYVFYVDFDSGNLGTASNGNRNRGRCVRLVRVY
ncbi:MAG: InlB B-repeat-containing protein [Bacteroidaceae bacterium]|nr:InlB B-repeat-containing protein [Bacteroidaceae bacterium]